MRLVAEHDHAEEVDGQPDAPNDEQHVGLVDLVRVEEPFDCLDEDGETEGAQEDGVEKSPEDFCPGPTEGVLLGGLGGNLFLLFVFVFFL